MTWQIGVDVGGTFTDLLTLDPVRGVFRVAKVLSTPEDQSIGFIAGLAELETDLAAVAALVHGTTVATNAVLERKGARIGLLTTSGFKDVLEIGRQMRHAMYDLALKPETPVFLAPGAFRKEVPERIGASGEIVMPVVPTGATGASGTGIFSTYSDISSGFTVFSCVAEPLAAGLATEGLATADGELSNGCFRPV